jgi:hypothetical protein
MMARKIRRPGSFTMGQPRRPSSASRDDLPPPEHPKITTNQFISKLRFKQLPAGFEMEYRIDYQLIAG